MSAPPTKEQKAALVSEILTADQSIAHAWARVAHLDEHRTNMFELLKAWENAEAANAKVKAAAAKAGYRPGNDMEQG